MNPKRSLQGFLYAALAAATFGLIPLFSNPAIRQGYTNDTILAYRYAIAAFSYGIFLLLNGKSLRIDKKQGGEILFAGVFCYGLTATFLLASYSYMPTGIATSIHFFYPVVVTILMSVFYKSKTPLSHKIAIGTAIVGVALLSWTEGRIKWIGIVFVLLSTLTYGGYMVALNRPVLKQMDAGVLTFWALSGSAVLYLFLGICRGDLVRVDDPEILIDLTFLGILSTTVSARLTVAAVKKIGSVPTSILGTLEPITAIITGILVFNEKFGLWNLAGFILVVLSVMLVLISGRNPSDH